MKGDLVRPLKFFYTKEELPELLGFKSVQAIQDMIDGREVRTEWVGNDELVPWTEVLRIRNQSERGGHH
jgi:hypothetical protein